MATVTLPTYKGTGFKFENAKLGTIIGGTDNSPGLLQYVLLIAGISMLFLLIAGGFGVMTSAGDPGKIKMGYGKISASVIGFLIIFASYLIVQVVEKILGVKIL